MDRLSYLNFVFSVADNELGPEGAKILAEMLRVSSSMTSVNLAINQLCGLDEYGRGTYDATGIKAIADALSVSSSMNKLNVLRNSIGAGGGQALVDAAPPQLQTFCGFDEGQTEADLSNKDLGSGDAVLLAWELTTGYVSSSMNSLK